MQKNQKICKIIEEFSLFILENTSGGINIDIAKGEGQSIITFTMEKCDEEIKSFILEKIKGERDKEIEEYGWELMGEGASDDDFGIINALVDEIEYRETEDKTVVRLVRHEQ